jgi:hypothetical protein
MGAQHCSLKFFSRTRIECPIDDKLSLLITLEVKINISRKFAHCEIGMTQKCKANKNYERVKVKKISNTT